MKAPDKIYANDYGIWYKEEQASKQTEQYIRKEALLKWIDEYKNYSSGPSWELLKTHIETL